MTAGSIFLLAFIGIRLIVAFINWLAHSYLPRRGLLEESSDLSVLIPARNEEQNLSRLLGSMAAFENQPREILVYDDHSTDRTADVVLSYAQKFNHIKLISGGDLPSGWLGKNHACFNLAAQASGRFLLFLDADVDIGDTLFTRALTFLQKHNLDLLSIFPQQRLGSWGEKISVPLMNWILLSLLPLPLIRLSKNPAFSAANGQFMLFRADSYKKLRPHEIFKFHKVEDIAINRFYKQAGLKTATLLGDEDIQCRMYTNLKEAITGFSKNVFQFFGNNRGVTVAFGMVTTFAPIFIFWQNGLILGLLYLCAAILIRLFVSLSSRQNVAHNLLLLVPQQVIFLFIIYNALRTHHQKELLWKDRNILRL